MSVTDFLVSFTSKTIYPDRCVRFICNVLWLDTSLKIQSYQLINLWGGSLCNFIEQTKHPSHTGLNDGTIFTNLGSMQNVSILRQGRRISYIKEPEKHITLWKDSCRICSPSKMFYLISRYLIPLTLMRVLSLIYETR
jgi:hypothetical protein